MRQIVGDNKFKLAEHQRFWRGLLFVAAGAFLLIRSTAADTHPFFTAAAWIAAIVALGALVLYVWSVVESYDRNHS
jgi:O-antigen/teichoic acid export membrane protein